MYLNWLQQERSRIENIPEAGQREKEGFILNLEDAQLRREAGRIESARFAYEDALLQAESSSAPSVRRMIPQIKSKMKSLPDGKGITQRPEGDY